MTPTNQETHTATGIEDTRKVAESENGWQMTDRLQRLRAPPIPNRYTGLELEHDEVVIYDRECTEAWIQSTHAVSITDANAEGPIDG